jgi:hypothetical protein
MDFSTLIDIVRQAGAGGCLIFGMMWWLERKERLRLQRIVESYLVTFETTLPRVIRSMNRVIGGADGDDGS